MTRSPASSPSDSAAAPQADTVVIRVHTLEDTRWVFVLERGKEALDRALGKVRYQTHWMPTPEEVRLHRAGKYDLFRRARQVFEIDRAVEAAQAAETPWTLRWRFVDPAGRVLASS